MTGFAAPTHAPAAPTMRPSSAHPPVLVTRPQPEADRWVRALAERGIVAQAFYQRCIRLGLRCDAPVDSQLQIMHSALTGPEDLVVVISYSGITSDPVLVLQEAKSRGAKTLCITGNSASPLARLADVVLVSVSHEQGSEPMAAQIAQMALIDALYSALVARNAERAQLTEERMVNAILPKSI